MPATKVQRVANAWRRYELDRTDRTSLVRENLRRRVAEELHKLRAYDLTLTDLIARVGNELVLTESVPVDLGNEYLAAMILREFYEAGPVPPSDTESPEENS